MDYEIAKDAIEDAAQYRREMKLPDDKGLSEAHRIICKGRIPITQHPDVQKLISQQVQLQAENKQYKKLLQKSIDLYFEYSNKDDFDKWVKETEQALKGE